MDEIDDLLITLTKKICGVGMSRATLIPDVLKIAINNVDADRARESDFLLSKELALIEKISAAIEEYRND